MANAPGSPIMEYGGRISGDAEGNEMVDRTTSDSKSWRDELLTVISRPKIIGGADLSWHVGRTVPPHLHDFYQLDYFYDGHGTVVVNSKRYIVHPGDLFASNPGETHEFQAAAHRPMEGITFKFRLGEEEHRRIFPNYIGNLARLSTSHRLELERYLRWACIEANSPDDESRLLAASLIPVFFIVLVRYLREIDGLAESVSERGSVQSVLRYIRRHYNRPLTLSDLSRIAGLNPRYLCGKFTMETGLSPMAALTRERIEAAKNLLTSTTLPISEIGTRVGYPDPYHFSKRFKEMTGVSPRQFRSETAS